MRTKLLISISTSKTYRLYSLVEVEDKKPEWVAITFPTAAALLFEKKKDRDWKGSVRLVTPFWNDFGKERDWIMLLGFA